MAMSHLDMQKQLIRSGCKEKYRVEKVIRYWLPKSKHVFYLERENISPQIVLLPALEVFLDELSSLDGVITKPPYYHNADMTMFPKRVNNGEKATHYGVAFEFENSPAVENFIAKLTEIVSKK